MPTVGHTEVVEKHEINQLEIIFNARFKLKWVVSEGHCKYRWASLFVSI